MNAVSVFDLAEEQIGCAVEARRAHPGKAAAGEDDYWRAPSSPTNDAKPALRRLGASHAPGVALAAGSTPHPGLSVAALAVSAH